MTFDDAQRAWDNLTPEDFEPPEVCEECGHRKCICDKLDEIAYDLWEER